MSLLRGGLSGLEDLNLVNSTLINGSSNSILQSVCWTRSTLLGKSNDQAEILQPHLNLSVPRFDCVAKCHFAMEACGAASHLRASFGSWGCCRNEPSEL